jgi:hypothetical protein
MKKERTNLELLELHIGKNIILLKGTEIFFDPCDGAGKDACLPELGLKENDGFNHTYYFTGKLEGNIQAYELIAGKKFTEDEREKFELEAIQKYLKSRVCFDD